MSSSSLEVALSLESSSANLLMTSQGMALLSPKPAKYICVRLPVGLSPHAVDAVLVDEDGVLQVLELCPKLVGLVGGIGGVLGLLESHLEVLDVVLEGGAEFLQLVLLQVFDLVVAISDVIKIQFVGRVGARRATGGAGHPERA
jgi:hypothetical protein